MLIDFICMYFYIFYNLCFSVYVVFIFNINYVSLFLQFFYIYLSFFVKYRKFGNFYHECSLVYQLHSINILFIYYTLAVLNFILFTEISYIIWIIYVYIHTT